MQRGLDTGSSAVNPRAHRAHRDLRGLRDLLIGQLAPSVEQQGVPEYGGELIESCGHLRSERLSLESIKRSVAEVGFIARAQTGQSTPAAAL